MTGTVFQWPRRRPAYASVDAPRLKAALRNAVPPLLFGLRLWASVCLALYVAFWLELDNPSWAGTSAAIVCQPHLGASLRKGWFRMIGTLVGAVMSVLLTACFPQSRALFLLSLALWGAACALAATLLRNFAAYAAALAGYTVAIIGGDLLGATGGVDANAAFLLAVTRATEICLGIVCAGVVLALTDFGVTRRRLAALFAELAAGIAAGFAGTLAWAGSELADTQAVRREFIRRIIALDPLVDETLGESSQIRYHSRVLQRAVGGLFAGVAAWRAVANHLIRLPRDEARQAGGVILQSLPPELRASPAQVEPTRWVADPAGLYRICDAATRGLIALPARTPSLRLLADKAAEALAGTADALNGLALLVAGPAQALPQRGSVRLHVPDWLPALVNAGRAFVTIGALALFWIVTAWPSGASAIVFATVLVVLLAPRGDQAYAGAMAFTVGTAAGVVFAAIIKFAVLPGVQTFPAFCVAIGVFLVPVGFGMAHSKNPAVLAVVTAMGFNFMPVLQPTNPISYDTVQFYNSALAIFVGCAVAPLSFRLLPPLSPALRTRRLLRLTLRDLRRLAMGRTQSDWEGHVHCRFSVMPDAATPLQRAQLLAALSAGSEIIRLRQIALGLGAELDRAFAALAQGRSANAVARLGGVDAKLAARTGTGPRAQIVLRARGSILALSEVLTQHAAYFDAGLLR
jgi:uncharacterized membrane protein YccC